LSLVENEPEAHAAHTRSLVAVPAVCTKEPAEHVVHAAQLAAFSPLENVPSAHAEHRRSAVVEPGVATNVPASQFDQGRQSVFGSES